MITSLELDIYLWILLFFILTECGCVAVFGPGSVLSFATPFTLFFSCAQSMFPVNKETMYFFFLDDDGFDLYASSA